MKKLNELVHGSSLCFCGKISPEAYAELAAVGIGAVEFSFGYDYYMNVADFPANAEKYGQWARENGVDPWSLHLPFSRKLDISNTDRELRAITMYTNTALIRAASRAGVSVIVLHPSSEPIAEEDRPERMRLSHENIARLAAECERLGMKLAVENLPRTCLCRTSDEIIALLEGTGAGVVFDTNHSLTEDNVDYVNALTAAGVKILTLHISDYYRDANGVLDERHCLPGEGINRWGELMDAIMKNGYDSPLMYEVPRQPKNHTVPITTEELGENMTSLGEGKIK